ncbi:four-helix bundle copper-binding protein [Desertimonas flava]|uniref:four-helix bundle copper-binding protein n=1 Tax=Desertimonas flava TaxID=2064846 RepID=UPI000E357918|nr:four-helix bundle copper-binding protein [Desertimonas flava]
MSVASQMLRTSPSQLGFDPDPLVACIDACLDCTQACTACADACLGEEMVADLRRCITSDLNCADICDTTARVLSRQAGYDAVLTRAVLTACRDACRRCAEECDRHADMHEHCRVCADACRRCEHACDQLLSA